MATSRDLEPAEGGAPVAVPERGAVPGLSGPQAQVLALQRTAGNAAVTRWLSGRAGAASVARVIEGNPGDQPQVVNPATGAVTTKGTVHAAPTLNDAANRSGPTKSAVGGQSIPRTAIRVKATESAPIEGETVAVQDLYEEGPAPTETDAATGAPAVAPGYTAIDEIRGDPTAPMVDEIADNSLFIDPGPKPADVQQGGIGDCWDMATFIGIVNRDPGKIQNIMVPDNSGGATVTLHHRQIEMPEEPGFLDLLFGSAPKPPKVVWTPEAVKVSNELAFYRSGLPGAAPNDRMLRNAAGPQFGHQLRGAKLQAAEKPKTRRWWCTIVGNTLEIHRVDIYQMARWSPLLEKAAARFSQDFGQYGAHGAGPAGTGEKRDRTQGYENLQGGYPGHTLAMFYGTEGEYAAGGQGGANNTQWTPAMSGSAALLTANAAAFDRLISITGTTPGRSPIVTARAYGGDAGEGVYMPRLQAAIPAAQADPDWAASVPAASQTAVATVLTNVTAWAGATPDPTPLPSPPPAGSKSATKAPLITSAKAIADGTAAHAALLAPARSGPIRAMVDLLLIVGRMPGDTGGVTRSVYSGHEYSVLSANIKMLPAAPAQITATPPGGRAALYPFVDIPGSTVLLMNPHHKNEPDSTGTGPADANNDGQFTVDLDRFFRLFAGVMSADVGTTPPPAPAP